MDEMQLVLYVVVLALIILGISALVELYKKQIRKDQSKQWENILIGAVLSILAVAAINVIGIFKPILGILGAPIWADYIAYAILIFVLQMQGDMKLIKKLIQTCVKNFLASHGLTEEQIDTIINSVSKSEEEK